MSGNILTLFDTEKMIVLLRVCEKHSKYTSCLPDGALSNNCLIGLQAFIELKAIRMT